MMRPLTITGLLFLMACSATSGKIQLTNEERSQIERLYAVAIVDAVDAHNPTLEVVQSSFGTQVRVLGSGGAAMSRATYQELTAASVEAATNCISETYDSAEFAITRFRSLISEVAISPRRTCDVIVASTEDGERFMAMNSEERSSFLQSVGADSHLIVRAYHKAGLHTRTFGIGIYQAAYSGFYSMIWDWESKKAIYHSGNEFTAHVEIDGSTFCSEFTDNYEAAADENAQRWLAAILGIAE